MLSRSKFRRLSNSIENNCSINKNSMITRVPCNSTPCLSCQQLFSTTTFKNNQTNKTFKIYHRVNWKTASLITYQNTISATFNTLVNQKHHSTLGSITTEKMSKLPMQFQLPNISTGTIMTLTITGESLSQNN